ncbi:MAG: threonine ammonia-lyase [Bdellovibrio sp.]
MMKENFSVSLSEVEKARSLINPHIRRTELDLSPSATKKLGKDIYFKFENEQLTGSFKIRGALNRILNLSSEEKARGVVASSAGNHAQGVALSAQKASVRCTIVMPKTAALIKVEATRSYGAEVVLYGEAYDDAFDKAQELERQYGFTFVHPYQDPHVIAGQGSLGLEMLEQCPDFDTLIVPVGGGGLISGISLAVKALRPQVRIIGVQSNQAPGMVQLFYGQELKLPPRVSTIADGIAIKRPSRFMAENFLRKYVDQMVTVDDDEIAEAIVFLMERAKSVTEGSGAAGFAAALAGKIPLGNKNLVLLCGGNIDLNMVAKIIQKGQIRRKRLAEISVIVSDLPGSLYQLTKILAERGANVLEVHHDRVSHRLALRETRIDFVIETINQEHLEEIRQALKQLSIELVN